MEKKSSGIVLENSSTSTEAHYSFQSNKENEHFQTVLNEQIKTFKKRLDVPDSIHAGEELLIRNFCYENILNIIWYQKAKKKARARRDLLNVFSFLLLLGLPVFIVLLAIFFKPYESKGYSTALLISSLIGFLVTAIISIHKFISDWVDSSKFLSQFHYAETELKNTLFRLENDWKRQCLTNEENREEFKRALEEAIISSRHIVSEETAKFFETLGNPRIDFSSLLKGSSSAAKMAVETFKTNFWKEGEIRKEINTREYQISRLREKLKDLDREFEILTSKEEKSFLELKKEEQLKEEIQSYIAEISIMEKEVIKKKAALTRF